MKLQRNNRSNKSSILAQKFCRPRLSALAPGLYTCIKSRKNLCKIRVQSSTYENVEQKIREIIASCNAQKFPHWSHLPLSSQLLNHEKIHIKSELKAVFLKLKANDQSSKGLICCLKLTPSDYLPLPREIKSVREHQRVKMFAVAGYHAVVCDAFIYLLFFFFSFFIFLLNYT